MLSLGLILFYLILFYFYSGSNTRASKWGSSSRSKARFQSGPPAWTETKASARSSSSRVHVSPFPTLARMLRPAEPRRGVRSHGVLARATAPSASRGHVPPAPSPPPEWPPPKVARWVPGTVASARRSVCKPVPFPGCLYPCGTACCVRARGCCYRSFWCGRKAAEGKTGVSKHRQKWRCVVARKLLADEVTNVSLTCQLATALSLGGSVPQTPTNISKRKAGMCWCIPSFLLEERSPYQH